MSSLTITSGAVMIPSEENPQECPVCGSRKFVPWLHATDRFHAREQIYSLTRCKSCSLVWLLTPPTPTEMSYHYGLDYHKLITNAGETKLLKQWRATTDRVREIANGGTLLDIGCSSGGFLRTLQDGAWKLYGIEISADQARKAESTSGASVFVGEVLDAPFAPDSFDVITGFHILEHVYRPRDVIRKVWQWLKPNGVLYLQLPNIEAAEARLFRSFWYGLELPRHICHFSPASLRKLASVVEFEELFVRTRPDCYVEYSLKYLVDGLLGQFGFSRSPLALLDRNKTFPWRVMRKAFRLGILKPFRHAAVAVDRGAAIEAAFRKAIP